MVASQNRKFFNNSRKIISEKNNLIDLCHKRYENIKKFLNNSEKRYYKKSLKKILDRKMNLTKYYF